MKNKSLLAREDIEKIISRCEVCYLALVDPENNPYVIPMNFGYNASEIFLHSSRIGKKIDILKSNNKVCVLFSTDHELRWQSEKVACSYSMKYRSVLAYGYVEFIEEERPKIDALNFIMVHYTGKVFDYSAPAVRDVMVFKVKIEKMEGREYGY